MLHMQKMHLNLLIQKNWFCEKRTLWPINVNFLAPLSENYYMNFKSSKLFYEEWPDVTFIKWGERSLLSYPFKPSTGISGQKLCLLSPQKKGFDCILKDYKTLAQVFTQLWRTSEVYTTEHQYNMGSLYMYIGTLYYEQSTDQHCVLYLFVILIFTPISHWSVHNQNHRLRLIWTFRQNPGPTNHHKSTVTIPCI